MVNVDRILLDSNVANWADYRLYLTSKYVETGPSFQMIKVQSLRISFIRAGEGFPLNLPKEVDVKNYQAILIQFEAFGQLITLAELQ